MEFSVDSGLTASLISREDLVAAKLAAGRPQDIADVAALSEHLDPAEQRSQETEVASQGLDMEAIRKKAVADWLAYRAQHQAAHGSQSLEERRAKAVEDWKKFRKEKGKEKEKSQGSDIGRSHAQDDTRTEREKENKKSVGKDAAEDPDL